MVEPMIAIAFERSLSRVRSAAIAIATPEIAPAPCSVRPAIMSHGASASAHRKLPAAKQASPRYIMGLRPRRSESQPNGSCSSPCVRPYAPSATPTSVSVHPGRPWAHSANTGRITNMPKRRSPKIEARERLARSSLGVMRPKSPTKSGIGAGRKATL